MIRGTTKSGFSFEIADDVFDDYELVEMFVRQRTDKLEIVNITERLLGPEQHEALKEHLKKRDGKVRLSAMTEEIAEIDSMLPTLKNS